MNYKLVHELYEIALAYLRDADDGDDGVRDAREAFNEEVPKRCRHTFYRREIDWAWREAKLEAF